MPLGTLAAWRITRRAPGTARSACRCEAASQCGSCVCVRVSGSDPSERRDSQTANQNAPCRLHIELDDDPHRSRASLWLHIRALAMAPASANCCFGLRARGDNAGWDALGLRGADRGQANMTSTRRRSARVRALRDATCDRVIRILSRARPRTNSCGQGCGYLGGFLGAFPVHGFCRRSPDPRFGPSATDHAELRRSIHYPQPLRLRMNY